MSKLNIAVIGATGFVGSAITKELINHGHKVLGISRKPSKSNESNLTYISADIMDTKHLADVIKGYDVVISAYNPGWQNPEIYDEFLKGSQSIQEAVKLAGIKRYIVIGGAGSLYVADGVQAVDTPSFPKEIYSGAKAARDYLNVLRKENLIDWVFFSPAFEMHPGVTTGRTGKYRLGHENPVFNDENRSILSVEDLAVVIADEIEKPKHHKERFTAGY